MITIILSTYASPKLIVTVLMGIIRMYENHQVTFRRIVLIYLTMNCGELRYILSININL